ncbi:MAG: protein kinase domain-containing protein [Woeseiaceae bacterium]
MSTEMDKTSTQSYEEQLSSLESRLQGHAGDEDMLADLGLAMRTLLSADGETETHIRATLQKQFDDGNLRKETYELVQNLLGKIVTEEIARAPLPDSSSMADDIFATTAVIEDQAQAQVAAQVAAQKQVAREDSAPVTEHNLQVGTVLRDRFLLKEQVAEGSMGVVYKALDRRLAEAGEEACYVAIKVLSPKLSRNGSALRALQQEASKGRCLTHPNIVRFIDLDREDELYFIIMEWIDGRSLSSILDENGGNALDLDTSLDIVRQAGSALDYAHQRGVIHADVKPGNIVITPTGDVKLIDFGVARVRQKQHENKPRFDPAAMQSGAPAYSSMQVLTGEDPVPADDVFSLACLLYRLVAGYRVYGPRNAAQAAEDGMEPQQPQGLSAAQWQPLKKALSYSRVTRYPTPLAFINALNTASGGPVKLESVQPPKESRIDVAEPVAPEPEEKAAATMEPASESEDPGATDLLLTQEFPQPKKNTVRAIRAEKESIMYEPEDNAPRVSLVRITAFAAIAVAAAFVASQEDLVDRIGQAIESSDVTAISDAFNPDPEIIDAPVIDESLQDIAEFVPANPADATADREATEGALDGPQAVAESTVGGDDEINAATEIANETGETETEISAEEVAVVAENLIDWSSLPPATVTIALPSADGTAEITNLAIREDSVPAFVDFTRTDSSEELTIDVSESEFTGNRSPLETGQYTLDNGGEIQFAAGQERARMTVSMRSNPVRESDSDVTLLVNPANDADTILATISLTLEDDDQRAFEEGLPPNTVAFAVNQISVRESDPAAQIDVVRFKADTESLEVLYELADVTATEGQDYFAPDLSVVYFAPGQRTARILVPLGQDTRVESDEAFMLKLNTASAPADSNLFSQIAVMIRDDDT